MALVTTFVEIQKDTLFRSQRPNAMPLQSGGDSIHNSFNPICFKSIKSFFNPLPKDCAVHKEGPGLIQPSLDLMVVNSQGQQRCSRHRHPASFHSISFIQFHQSHANLEDMLGFTTQLKKPQHMSAWVA